MHRMKARLHVFGWHTTADRRCCRLLLLLRSTVKPSRCQVLAAQVPKEFSPHLGNSDMIVTLRCVGPGLRPRR